MRLAGGRNGAGAQGDADRVAEVVKLAPQFSACCQRVAALGGRAHQFFNQHGIGHAAPSGGIEAVFYRHIVIDYHGGDLDAAFVQQLGGGFKVKNIASVVFNNQQHAFAAVDVHGALKHFIRRRGGENFPRTGPGKHALANISAVHRLMTAAAAGKQRYFPGHRCIGAGDVDRIMMQRQFRVRFCQARQLFTQDIFDTVNQFFHCLFSIGVSMRPLC